MAQTILPYLKNEDVIQFANDVVKVQTQEIEQMKAWQAAQQSHQH